MSALLTDLDLTNSHLFHTIPVGFNNFTLGYYCPLVSLLPQCPVKENSVANCGHVVLNSPLCTTTFITNASTGSLWVRNTSL